MPKRSFGRHTPEEWIDIGNKLTHFLDEKAGEYRLTPKERFMQKECRQKFVFYDPGSQRQREYMRELEKEWESIGFD